ncbi:MAG TPA: shikimate dehydrogenase [Desulfobulbus sp.]|nr:shikimate dehydrogenase [Desulfobulbus sp.]
MRIDGKTRLYGIIGHPVGHSMSPAMHNAAFAATGINGVYVAMDVEDAGRAVRALRELGYIGVSVTVPHKEAVMAHVDEIDPVARRIGAVNTLFFYRGPGEKDVVVRGFNTDWQGSNLALAEKIRLAGSRVLVLGAGGAARAVGFGLVEAGAEVMISNRTEAKGRALARSLGCRFVAPERLAEVRGDVLVNTTPVGMTPHVDALPIDPALLPRFSLVMDIVYAPLETRLLREAAAAGCRVIDGLAMLQYQGAVQFKIWTGRQPPVEVMRRALLEQLQV